MNERARKNEAGKNRTSPQVAFRMDEEMFLRLQRIVSASRRSKTSVLEECLERVLPDLEKQYSKAA